jgi:hypothetical protein
MHQQSVLARAPPASLRYIWVVGGYQTGDPICCFVWPIPALGYRVFPQLLNGIQELGAHLLSLAKT